METKNPKAALPVEVSTEDQVPSTVDPFRPMDKKPEKKIAPIVYGLCGQLILEKLKSLGRFDDVYKANDIFHQHIYDEYNGIYDMLLVLIQKNRYGAGEPEITADERKIFDEFIESLKSQDRKGFLFGWQDIASLAPQGQTAGKKKNRKTRRRRKKN